MGDANLTPLVTVVSGYYNRERFVDDSINSILDQTYKNIKLLVFDDCSTDGTYKKLLALQEKDDRIKIIKHSENIGFVKGMINALEQANGDLVAIQGSGDLSLVNRIEKQVDFLNNNPDHGFVGTLKEIYDKAQQKVVSKGVYKGPLTITKDVLISGVPFTHGSAMFRKNIYDQTGGYRSFFKYCQDRDLWMRMADISKGHVIPQYLYRQLASENSISFSPNGVAQEKYYYFVEKLALSDKQEQDELVKQLLVEGIDKVVPLNEEIILANLKRSLRFLQNSNYVFAKQAFQKMRFTGVLNTYVSTIKLLDSLKLKKLSVLLNRVAWSLTQKRSNALKTMKIRQLQTNPK